MTSTSSPLESPPGPEPTPEPTPLTTTPETQVRAAAPLGLVGDGFVSAACCLAAACSLGLALQISDGVMHPEALAGVGRTLALSGVAVLTARVGRWNVASEGLLCAGLLIALGLQIKPWFAAEPGQHLFATFPWPYARLYAGLCLQALVAGVLIGSPWRVRRFLIPLLSAAFLPVGLWLMSLSPQPNIDVWFFQHDAADHLLHGHNPYTMTFPNVFGTDVFYGPGMVRDGRLLFGFPYPPLSLYFATLGQLFGDPRYAHLTCMALAALLMGYMHRGRLAVGAAALYLFTPRALVVLQMGWTEPILVALLAATVFAARRYPRAVPYLFGCLLAVKQYMVFFLPLVFLLTPLRGKALLAFLLRAAAVGLVLTLPLVLIDPHAFLWSVVKLQFYQPFRMDALSYLPWWVARGHAQPPVGVAFAAAGLAIALSLWRLPRTPAGFATAAAFVYCAFFAFNKQAFVNYYFFVVGALCVALASHEDRDPFERALPLTAAA